jgi:hypothetical protein
MLIRMTRITVRPLQLVGIIMTTVFLVAFFARPSFPTPDKIFIFLTFVFMIFGQAWALFRRLLPFVAIILVYESFRSLASQLNSHVNYALSPHIDKLLFGNLPTIYLQNWLWKGHTSWYDYVLYIPYLFHFVLPFCLAILVWKTREKYYWQVIFTYSLVAFMGFTTFLIMPTAPPWLASQTNHIQHITRISSDVWAGLGLHNFPSIYNKITPNEVAAVPSLHAAWAVLLVIFVYKLYGQRWALLAAIYPALIFIGTVYEAEHYAFDILIGVIYAVVGYLISPYLLRYLQAGLKKAQRFERIFE